MAWQSEKLNTLLITLIEELNTTFTVVYGMTWEMHRQTTVFMEGMCT